MRCSVRPLVGVGRAAVVSALLFLLGVLRGQLADPPGTIMKKDTSPVIGATIGPHLKRFLPGLNALTEALLLNRARRDGVASDGITVARLTSRGLTLDDCRELLAQRLVAAHGKLTSSSVVTLTDAGLALMQRAIPVGAIRPIFDVSTRELSVAGETILRLAVQARNLAPLLTAIETARWSARVARPLDGRRCAGDAHRLAVATNRLNLQQPLIDFHADDGAVRWNWRQGGAANGR